MKNLVRYISKTKASEYTTHMDNSEEIDYQVKNGMFLSFRKCQN